MSGPTHPDPTDPILTLAVKAGVIEPEEAAAARAAGGADPVQWLVDRRRLDLEDLAHLRALLDATLRRRMQATLPPMEVATGPATALGAPPPTLHGGPRSDLETLHMPDRIGPYAITAVLGQGAMGTVYRARADGAGADVALKVLRADVLSPAVIARFRREADAARALADHPAIVGVQDIGVADGRTFFAMDLVEGPTLDRVIQAGELAPMRAARIVAGVARGVHYAHTEGILHRDIKPGNILLDAGDQPHVVDFGLATRQAADEAAARLTRTGELIGTPAYMAPEQVANTAVDVRADIWALGATLYDAVCGHPPFVGQTSYDILRQVTTAEPAPARRANPTVPVPLETIIGQCLRRDPAERYATAEALADDLDRFIRAQPIEARPESRWRRTARRVRLNPAPWLAGGITLLVVLVAVVGFAIERVRARNALRDELHLAVELTAGDPDRALGILESLAGRAPDLPGLSAARAAAAERRDAMALEGLRARAATLLSTGRAAAERHHRAHTEWQQLQAEDDAALVRELDGAAADHDPGQAERRARLAVLGPERDDAYAAAQASLGAAVQLLSAYPTAPEREAAAALAAELAWTRLQAAEARFDRDAAARFAHDLATHGAATHARAIAGTATLTLDTEPSGATVECRRYVERDGILVAESGPPLGPTPLTAVALPMGSYLLELRTAGYAPVRYPVLLTRLEAHVLPGPVRLLTPAQMGDGFVYVPGGWSVLGNDGKARTAWPPHRAWVDPFLIGRDEVTVGEYAAWIQDLVRRGEPEEAVLAHVPRQNPRSGFYWSLEGGGIRSRIPAEASFPIGGISWDDAMAYAEWRGARDGRVYRLATGDEWQRAGRGADGRRYPWGNLFDWRRCVGGRWPGHGEMHWAAPAGSAPDDCSPFGARDLCGNLEEWTGDGWHDGAARGRRGGCWGLGGLIDFHLANHGTTSPGDVNLTRGFRLAADLPK